MLKSFKRVIFSLLTIVCIVLQIFLYTSCSYRTSYRFDQPIENVQSIEIVEAYYDHDTVSGDQRVLFNIDSIDQFVDKINKLEYRESLFSIFRGIDKRSLCVKVSYANGDYELFDCNTKTRVACDKGYYDGSVCGWFEETTFNAFIYGYLDDVEDCQYSFYHNISEIFSIELVNSSVEGDNIVTCKTLAVVEDHAGFIEQLNDIYYVYTNDTAYYEKIDQNNAIKITYQNGDYEIFTHNHRDEVEFLKVGRERVSLGTYIGTFDEEAFYNLVNQYLPK